MNSLRVIVLCGCLACGCGRSDSTKPGNAGSSTQPSSKAPSNVRAADVSTLAAVAETFLKALAAGDPASLAACMSDSATGIAALAREQKLSSQQFDELRKKFDHISATVAEAGIEQFEATVVMNRIKVRIVREIDLGHGLRIPVAVRSAHEFGLPRPRDVAGNRDAMAALLGEKLMSQADAVFPPGLESKFRNGGVVAYESDANNRVRTTVHNLDIGGGRRGVVFLRLGWDGQQPTFQAASADWLTMEHLLGKEAVLKAAGVAPPAPKHQFPAGGGATDLTLDAQGHVDTVAHNIDIGEGRRGVAVLRISPSGEYQGILTAEFETARSILGAAPIAAARDVATQQLVQTSGGKLRADDLHVTNLSTDASGAITALTLVSLDPNALIQELAVPVSPRPGQPAEVRWAIADLDQSQLKEEQARE